MTAWQLFLAVVALAGCAQASEPVRQLETKDGRTPTGALAAAMAACEGQSKRVDEDANDPLTYTRSDYDRCMAKQANESSASQQEICTEASGDWQGPNAKPEFANQCILVIA